MADPGVGARWPELTAQVQEALATRADIDACARVELAIDASSIDVSVTLPDGRAAFRRLSRPDDVVPTLEALLLVPAAAIEATSTPASAGPAPARATQAFAVPVPIDVAIPARDETPPPHASHPSSRLRVEFSVLTDARIGAGQASVGLGADSLLAIGDWLVGLDGCAERDHLTGDAYTGATLELAALGGRRLRFESLALDFVGGPAVALRARRTDTTVAPGASPSPQSSPGPKPHALVGARLVLGARSLFRTFIGINGELGAANSSGADSSPLWTLGLSLGATMGTK